MSISFLLQVKKLLGYFITCNENKKKENNKIYDYLEKRKLHITVDKYMYILVHVLKTSPCQCIEIP